MSKRPTPVISPVKTSKPESPSKMEVESPFGESLPSVRLEDVIFETQHETRSNLKLVSKSENWPFSFIAGDALLSFKDVFGENVPAITDLEAFLNARAPKGSGLTPEMDKLCHIMLYRWLENFREEKALPKPKRRVLLEQWAMRKEAPTGIRIE